MNLHVGSGAHGEQTAAVIAGVERELIARRPVLLVVYGDVNSTLGAALAAAKLHVPAAHVEAGLRSFDNTMPEEINRRLTDQLCELLFVTSPEAVGYLAREGITAGGVHFVGNTMIDTLVACLGKLDAEAARPSTACRNGTWSRRCTGRSTSTARRRRRCWSRQCTRQRTWRR